jgi:hypothetical protein
VTRPWPGFFHPGQESVLASAFHGNWRFTLPSATTRVGNAAKWRDSNGTPTDREMPTALNNHQSAQRAAPSKRPVRAMAQRIIAQATLVNTAE